MFHRLLLPLSLLVLLGACVEPSQRYTVSISPKFTPERQAVVLAALDDWTHAANARGVQLAFDVVITDGDCAQGGGFAGAKHSICIVPSTQAAIEALGAPSNMVGWTKRSGNIDSATSWIALDRLHGGDVELETTVAHEVGHAMGLVHIPIEGTDVPLMAPAYVGRLMLPGDRDIDQLAGSR
jgi:hypothetical protein